MMAPIATCCLKHMLVRWDQKILSLQRLRELVCRWVGFEGGFRSTYVVIRGSGKHVPQSPSQHQSLQSLRIASKFTALHRTSKDVIHPAPHPSTQSRLCSRSFWLATQGYDARDGVTTRSVVAVEVGGGNLEEQDRDSNDSRRHEGRYRLCSVAAGVPRVDCGVRAEVVNNLS